MPNKSPSLLETIKAKVDAKIKVLAYEAMVAVRNHMTTAINQVEINRDDILHGNQEWDDSYTQPYTGGGHSSIAVKLAFIDSMRPANCAFIKANDGYLMMMGSVDYLNRVSPHWAYYEYDVGIAQAMSTYKPKHSGYEGYMIDYTIESSRRAGEYGVIVPLDRAPKNKPAELQWKLAPLRYPPKVWLRNRLSSKAAAKKHIKALLKGGV